SVLPDVVPSGDGNHRFALHVTIHNFRGQVVKGTLAANVGDSLCATHEDVTIRPFTDRTIVIEFPAIPPSFSFTDFSWDVCFHAGEKVDVFSDRVNIPRALLRSFIHLRNVQRKYEDGRFSHHYFGDAYGARAQLAYASYLKHHPDLKQENEDLWQ